MSGSMIPSLVLPFIIAAFLVAILLFEGCQNGSSVTPENGDNRMQGWDGPAGYDLLEPNSSLYQSYEDWEH